MKCIFLILVISLVIEDAKLPPLKESEIVAGHTENAKNISFLSLKKPNSPDHLSKEEYLKCEYANKWWIFFMDVFACLNLKTWMHSSRMCTVRCSGRLQEGVGVSAQGGYLSGGVSAWGVSA